MTEIIKQKLGASEKTAIWVRWIHDLAPPYTKEQSEILFQNLERLLFLHSGKYYVHDQFGSDSAMSNYWHLDGAKAYIRIMEKIGTVDN